MSLQIGLRAAVRAVPVRRPSHRPTSWPAARAEVDAQLDSAVEAHPRYRDTRRLVGLAGTVRRWPRWTSVSPPTTGTGCTMPCSRPTRSRRWFRRLAAEDAPARLARPGMVPGREDVIVGGALDPRRRAAAVRVHRVPGVGGGHPGRPGGKPARLTDSVPVTPVPARGGWAAAGPCPLIGAPARVRGHGVGRGATGPRRRADVRGRDPGDVGPISRATGVRRPTARRACRRGSGRRTPGP